MVDIHLQIKLDTPDQVIIYCPHCYKQVYIDADMLRELMLKAGG